ncbi:MAG: CRISPR-associated endonuclease Cas3'', partial [Deltaproteobacteria bacterium]
GDELDLAIAWREADGGLTAEALAEQAAPVRDELCPVPVSGARQWVEEVRKRDKRVLYHDHLDERWVEVRGADLRPGMILVADAAAGGYDPERGWDPSVRDPVPPVVPDDTPLEFESDVGVGDDPTSLQRGRWVRLGRHLGDVEREATLLAGHLVSDSDLAEAVVMAGAVHDIGKAHPVFQDTMVRSAPEADRVRVEAGRPWAKSAGKARHARERRHFRHELASALALDAAGDPVVGRPAGDWWRNLVTYLVAAHHGRVRLAIRSAPDEVSDPGAGGGTSRTALGVRDGDEMPAVETPRGVVGACVLELSCMELGRRPDDGAPSWTERALDLLERLGPFTLAYLEALVRLADWRASAAEDAGPDDLATFPEPSEGGSA